VIRSSRGAKLSHRLLVVAAAALIPALAGCEAGASAPTLSWHQPTDGAGTVVGGPDGIAIRDVFVLGAPLNGTLAAGQSAGLFLALVNSGKPDKLISVTAPGTATSVTLPGGQVALPSQQAVLLTGPQPKVILDGLTHALAGGSFIRIILNFQDAGSVTLQVPVMPQAQYYSTFSPAPTPTPTPTKARSHSPSPSASPTPGVTPTPSPSPDSTP
jgi:copper(I)-binding protein